MKELFMLSGILIICFGLAILVLSLIFPAASSRRSALSVLLAGALVALGSTFSAPDVTAAAGERERIVAKLDAGQTARQATVDRWAAAQAPCREARCPHASCGGTRPTRSSAPT